MNDMPGKKIFKRLERKSFSPVHVAEVGVYLPETSNVYDYIQRGVRSTLVEADPYTVDAIRSHFADYSNVTVIPVAVADRSGSVELIRRAASTFLKELPDAPAMANDGYALDQRDAFTVKAVTFDEIDDGSIDLLSVDIEGGEWLVIKHLRSRPAVISLETHGAAYVNPYIVEIKEWMRENGYRILYKDRTDSVYVNERIPIGWIDTLGLSVMTLYLAFRRRRRLLKRFLLRGKHVEDNLE